MTFRRYIVPSIVAGAIFVLPYAFLIGAFLALIAGAPHDSPRTVLSIITAALVIGLVLDILMSFVPATFFLIARHSWASEDKIVRAHLFGWPLGIALIAGASMSAYFLSGAFSLSPSWILAISVLMTAGAASCGLVAAIVWRRMAYRG